MRRPDAVIRTPPNSLQEPMAAPRPRLAMSRWAHCE